MKYLLFVFLLLAILVPGVVTAQPPPPVFSKSFTPNTIFSGGNSTLVFTIDNSASGLAAASLDFADNLPAGVVVNTPPNASTTCTGGTLTAVAGASVVSYTGGSVAAGATCTVQVDVTSDIVGVYVNTSGDLTSSIGNSGPATDTLTVNPAAALPTAIPTINEWGMIIFMVLAGLGAINFMAEKNLSGRDKNLALFY
jgi:hypothetical protein